MAIARQDITGLVLAGGRGSRMGGVDKGLQLYRGVALAQHALQRLEPQVGRLAVNANRNLEAYAVMGVPVWPDADASFAGPLAGALAGLAACRTAWLVTAACDTPAFPLDLVHRLAQACDADGADVAMASGLDEDGTLRTQPVFSLLRRELHDDLAAFLREGERKVDRWTARHRCVIVPFDEAGAFVNVNTPDELQRLG